MENVKETASDVAALEKKMDIIIQYLSSMQYLMMYGDKINKNEHYTAFAERIEHIKLNATSIQEHHQ